LAFSLLVVVLLAFWSGKSLWGSDPTPDGRTKAWVDAILFWGVFALIAGVLGTLIGVINAAGAIQAASEVSAPLVWGGMRVALLSSSAGALILAFAALLWFGLQLRWRLLWSDREEALA
jgi:hypothetical protein